MSLPAASKKEQICVDFLKQKYPADTAAEPEDAGYLCDETYLRFARARDGDQKKADEMLKAALAWRKSYRPFAITAKDVEAAMEQLTMTCGGNCKDDRPLLVMTLAVPNECSTEERTKQLVYILEETQRKGYDNITWIIDMGEMGKHKKDPRSAETRKVTNQIMRDYYPERLGKMILFRPPWYVRMAIGVAKTFMDKRTAAKIFKVGSDPAELDAYVAKDQRPTCVGGTMETGGLKNLEHLKPYGRAIRTTSAAAAAEDKAENNAETKSDRLATGGIHDNVETCSGADEAHKAEATAQTEEPEAVAVA